MRITQLPITFPTCNLSSMPHNTLGTFGETSFLFQNTLGQDIVLNMDGDPGIPSRRVLSKIVGVFYEKENGKKVGN